MDSKRVVHVGRQTPEDHGTALPSGCAAHARPSRLINTEGEYRGSIADGHTVARRYQDSHLIDRLWRAGQIYDRHYEAALRVLQMHDESCFEPRTVGSYAPHGWLRGHDDDSEENAAITRFPQLLGNKALGDRAWLLHSLCLGDFPSGKKLQATRAVLGELADEWKMTGENVVDPD